MIIHDKLRLNALLLGQGYEIQLDQKPYYDMHSRKNEELVNIKIKK